MTQLNNYVKVFFYSLIISSFIVGQDDFGDFNDEIESSDNNSDPISVTGVITDANTGRPLAGANITVDDTDLGADSDADGNYIIDGVELGASLTASVIGYDNVSAYADQETVDFALVRQVIEMSSLEVLASRDGEKTAVAYTNVSK